MEARGLIHRNVADRILEALSDTPVVVIQGARQVGKSTLAATVIDQRGGHIVSLDSEATRRAARLDPDGFVESNEGLLCIDEIQRVPELLLSIKAAVDRDRRPGRFLVTGSANLVRLRSVADSLAGRVETIELFGFSQDELAGGQARFVDQAFRDEIKIGWTSPLTRTDYLIRACSGGFPEAVARLAPRRRAWFESYARHLVERDAPDVGDGQRFGDLPRLLRLIAARNATELNLTDLAADARFSARSLPRYLDLLETLYVSWRIPAWSTNLTKRVIGRPKILLADTGLAASLLHLSPDSMAPTADPNPAGQLLEAFVANEIRRQLGWNEEPTRMFHFRDRTGPEIDIILEHADGRVVAIDVKASTSLGARSTRWLAAMRDRMGSKFVAGIVFYTGSSALSLGDRLAAVPLEGLWTSASPMAA